MTMRTIGVIPARWGSTRFPGKSLHPVAGKPLLQWVFERASRARELDELLVATDDERIASAALAMGAEVVMTSPAHPSGTDRVAEAIRDRPAAVAINIQGDEPLIDPGLIDRLAAALQEPGAAWDMATAAVPLTDPVLIASPSVVKAVRDARGAALYFSRAPIPFVRDASDRTAARYLRHVGIYAYRREFLEALVRRPRSPLEISESLEQLRALEGGARIRVLDAEDAGVGVDTPDDVPRAEAALRAAGLA
jgi:3-deoxy-manno-octulosonate cytidylyltransferase (CMP-KDO synthetase)